MKSLTIIGLVLGIMGVVILFKWGPPQPSFERGASIGLEDDTKLSNGKTVTENNADLAALEKCHKLRSKIGLGLVGLGFVFQLWGAVCGK
jgi:hypothetical protein